MARFQPGQSGNPNGRPKKERALTTILERAGSATIEVNGKKVSGRRLMALYLWQAVTTGQITFPDGKTIILSPADILAIIQFLYRHIDGPPVAAVDVTTGGESIRFIIERDDGQEIQPISPAT